MELLDMKLLQRNYYSEITSYGIARYGIIIAELLDIKLL